MDLPPLPPEHRRRGDAFGRDRSLGVPCLPRPFVAGDASKRHQVTRADRGHAVVLCAERRVDLRRVSCALSPHVCSNHRHLRGDEPRRIVGRPRTPGIWPRGHADLRNPSPTFTGTEIARVRAPAGVASCGRRLHDPAPLTLWPRARPAGNAIIEGESGTPVYSLGQGLDIKERFDAAPGRASVLGVDLDAKHLDGRPQRGGDVRTAVGLLVRLSEHPQKRFEAVRQRVNVPVCDRFVVPSLPVMVPVEDLASARPLSPQQYKIATHL